MRRNLDQDRKKLEDMLSRTQDRLRELWPLIDLSGLQVFTLKQRIEYFIDEKEYRDLHDEENRELLEIENKLGDREKSLKPYKILRSKLNRIEKCLENVKSRKRREENSWG